MKIINIMLYSIDVLILNLLIFLLVSNASSQDKLHLNKNLFKSHNLKNLTRSDTIKITSEEYFLQFNQCKSKYYTINSEDYEYINNRWIKINTRSYALDKNGQITSIENNHSNEMFEIKSRQIYKYLNGKIIEYIEQSKNNSDWINISKISYTYQDNGNTNESIQYDYIDNQWVPQTKTVEKSGLNGEIAEHCLFTLIGNKWILNYKETSSVITNQDIIIFESLREYYDNGNILNGSIEHRENKNGVNIYYFCKVFDPSSKSWIVVNESTTSHDESNRSYISINTLYDNRGTIKTKIIEETWLTDSINTIITKTFVYDNQKIDSIFEKHEIIFDSQRQTIAEMFYNNKNETWVPFQKALLLYDNNNYVGRLTQKYVSNYWENVKKESYLSSENIVFNLKYSELKLTNYDWLNNNWIETNSQKNLYVYNGSLDWNLTENSEIFLRGESIINGWKSVYKYSQLNYIPSNESAKLFNNFPNPFNSSTTIYFNLPEDSQTELKLYNTLGQGVKTLINEYRTKGIQSISIDANSLSNGAYFYTLKAGNFYETKKMVLLK
jgi:hypothetical protein